VIHVVAEIVLAPGCRPRFLEELGRLAPEVRAEPGCLEYAGAIDLASGLAAAAPIRPDVVTVVEKWRDVAALDAHLRAPHMERYRERVRNLVRDVVIRVLTPADDRG
jgi:quinol monooxygenase YgiN